MPKQLTKKLEQFCQEYLVDLNATQAAIRSGYSKRNATKIGHQVLQKHQVQERLAVLMNKRERKTEISQEMVLQELAKIAFSDLRNFVSWSVDGVLVKDSEQISDEHASAISEIIDSKSGKDGDRNIRIKLHDKVAALEKIGKHLGMFKDNHNVFLHTVIRKDLSGKNKDNGDV